MIMIIVIIIIIIIIIIMITLSALLCPLSLAGRDPLFVFKHKQSYARWSDCYHMHNATKAAEFGESLARAASKWLIADWLSH